MLSCSLCERQKFSESHKLKCFGARNQVRAARFMTVSFIGCSMNAIELVVRNLSVGGLGTTKSRDMTLVWWLLTSSEMSVLHVSHVWWPIPRWKWLSNYENRRLGPLGSSILDPIYVIYAFGSMISCILCERQTFSESHKLKLFGARNQFRAARFVTVLIIARSLNAMEWVVEN